MPENRSRWEVLTMTTPTTPRSRRGLAATAVLLALAVPSLSGCTEATAEAVKAQPATVETVNGKVGRMTLTPKAVERLGISTAPVVTAGGQLQVPQDAVLYAPDGSTFVYTSPAARTFLKAAVTVSGMSGDVATLSAGPPAGTQVVTVGGSELYGVETGLGSK